MRGICLSFILLLLSVGCHAIVPLPLTPEGEKVFLLGANAPLIIPGKPLDKCSVINQLSLYTNLDDYRRYTTSGCDNALRNKTADLGGNVAILVSHDADPKNGCYAVHGMALSCSEGVLKSAGLNRSKMESIIVNPDDTTTPEPK